MRVDTRWSGAQLFVAEYSVGKRWNACYLYFPDGKEDVIERECRVVGVESVTVGAGTFESASYRVGGLDDCSAALRIKTDRNLWPRRPSILGLSRQGFVSWCSSTAKESASASSSRPTGRSWREFCAGRGDRPVVARHRSVRMVRRTK